jgi:hypothetical protein
VEKLCVHERLQDSLQMGLYTERAVGRTTKPSRGEPARW